MNKPKTRSNAGGAAEIGRCRFAWCKGIHYAKGLCEKHYKGIARSEEKLRKT